MKTAIKMIESQLDGIKDAGLWKNERVITGPQQSWIEVGGRKVACHVVAG